MGAYCNENPSFSYACNSSPSHDLRLSKHVHGNVHGNIYLDPASRSETTRNDLPGLSRGSAFQGLELGIDPFDVQTVKIAGLLHDIGHGPFSHLFESEFLPKILNGFKWTHEQMSANLIDHIVDVHHIDVESEMIKRVEEMILASSEFALPKSVKEKQFLYDIVANGRNGIDMDKFDYIVRDSRACGLGCSFDIHRLFSFNSRHLANSLFELMVVDALLKANSYLEISSSIQDPSEFWKLDDTIIKTIETAPDEELQDSRDLILRIRRRNLYQFCNEYSVPKDKLEHFKNVTAKDIACSQKNGGAMLKEEDIAVSNGFESEEKFPIPDDSISHLLPTSYQDMIVRVYAKKPELVAAVSEAFEHFQLKMYGLKTQVHATPKKKARVCEVKMSSGDTTVCLLSFQRFLNRINSISGTQDMHQKETISIATTFPIHPLLFFIESRSFLGLILQQEQRSFTRHRFPINWYQIWADSWKEASNLACSCTQNRQGIPTELVQKRFIVSEILDTDNPLKNVAQVDPAFSRTFKFFLIAFASNQTHIRTVEDYLVKMGDNNNKTLTAILATLTRLTTQVERFDEIVRERQKPQLDLPNQNPRPNNAELLVPGREQPRFQAPELFAKPKFTIPSFKGDNDPDRSSVEDYYKEMQSLLNRANITEKEEVTVSRFVVGLNSNITDLLDLHGYENLEDTLKKAMTIEAQIQRRFQFKENYQGISSSYQGNPSNPSSSSTPSSLKKLRDDKPDKDKERPAMNDTLPAPIDQMIICEEVGKAKKEKAEKEAKEKKVTSYKSQKNNDPWEDFREVLGDPPNKLPPKREKQHQTNLIQVRAHGIQVNDEKVKATRDWTTPSSIAMSCRIVLGDPPDGLPPESPNHYVISMKNHDLRESKGKVREVVIHTKHNSFKYVTYRGKQNTVDNALPRRFYSPQISSREFLIHEPHLGDLRDYFNKPIDMGFKHSFSPHTNKTMEKLSKAIIQKANSGRRHVELQPKHQITRLVYKRGFQDYKKSVPTKKKPRLKRIKTHHIDPDSRMNPFEEWGNDTCTRVHNTCFFGLMFLLEPIRRTKSQRFKAYLFEREDDTCITRLTSKEEVITLPNDPLVQALEKKIRTEADLR
ncbi:HD domain-containing metal-dependent phosphohydrolase family protein isoform 4 [Hibiscus syriacus]|uniref:HD domain-containing metal-dependent phosphohydrolase family protein isoform 4 n=1 Tax=Hibiscus syriacus TaxID=106335 RepID=A0A6A2XRS0_HIBSY|nr:HD domain-containing metal-dependent phosphohydrolase family protein isoform 4 [Hibiscus syriacus]